MIPAISSIPGLLAAGILDALEGFPDQAAKLTHACKAYELVCGNLTQAYCLEAKWKACGHS